MSSAATETNEEDTTLAQRLAGSRSVVDRDLHQLIGFLYETLGRWYQLESDGAPPSTDPANIIITPQSHGGPAEETDGSGLLDSGDRLTFGPTLSTGERAEEEAEDGAEEPGPDERQGVFNASACLAQVSLGRERGPDESWDDVIQQLEADNRPALASALWVGLAGEPQARYGSIGQWRRAVDTALRSDAATATMVDKEDGDRRFVPMTAVALAVVALAAGLFWFLNRDTTTAETAEAADDTATVEAEDGVDADAEPEGPETSTDETVAPEPQADQPADDQPAAEDDPSSACARVGPLGAVTIDQVSETKIVVSWVPTGEAVDITLDGAFVDTVPAEAFRYVIETLPLTETPLSPDTEYTVGVEPQTGEPSTACATTNDAALPGDDQLIGVTAPTGVTVIDTSATSITVTWDPRPGADTHNVYLDGAYLQFGDVGGSSTVGDETEFTFLDLEPDTTYDIGVRRIEGPNQSRIVTVTATTDPG